MPNWIKITKKFLFIYLFIILMLGSFFLFFKTRPNLLKPSDSLSKEKKDINILEEKVKWSERIKKVGPEVAYKEFKETFSSNIESEQHSVAHLFGELMYGQLKNTSGITVCDYNFGFGCFHGFFVAALHDKGPDILIKLDKACVEKSGMFSSGCQHGLGHGLIEYYGHNIAGLNKSLLECEKTTIFAKKFGCTSGAFMEFNIPISLEVNNIHLNTRKLDKTNPYFPCSDVPSRFQESCYFELGQWWKSALNGDYASMGNFCSNVGNEVNKESCYLGIGHILVSSLNYNIKDSVKTCEQMPNQDGKLLCISGVTWEIFGNVRTRSKTMDACKTFPKNIFDKCIRKGDLIKSDGTTFQGL